MAKQQTFRLHSRTSINDLVVSEEPIPTPGPREVLIKIRSVALNYRDYAIAVNKYPFSVKESVVPCSDLAGEVVEVGRGVEDLAPGDQVISAFDLKTLHGTIPDWEHGLGGGVDGGLREYIVLPAEIIVKIPPGSGLTYAQMASLVCTGTTAWNSLYGNTPLRPGQTVLFLGTGGVSLTGLMFAKAAGATTIITSSSDDKLKFVQEKYGADHVINYNTTPNWAAEVQKITAGRGVDYILENGGAGTIQQSLEAVAYGGIIAVIGILSYPKDEMPNVAGLALAKGAVVRGIIIGSKQQLEDLTRFVVSRKLQVPVEREFGFSREEVVAAYEFLASGQHTGKICINVQ
ncbi:hypothetical protein ACHAQA_007369 [Verticillium albo-atrum]